MFAFVAAKSVPGVIDTLTPPVVKFWVRSSLVKTRPPLSGAAAW